ncbi:hypothetical protein [Bartonella sp. B1099]
MKILWFAQKAFHHRARMNHLVALGQWIKEQGTKSQEKKSA